MTQCTCIIVTQEDLWGLTAAGTDGDGFKVCGDGWRCEEIPSPCRPLVQIEDTSTSSSSRMRVINHNWSATKQCPHLQSVAEISRHSVLSGDRIRQCETSSGSRHKDTDQCL